MTDSKAPREWWIDPEDNNPQENYAGIAMHIHPRQGHILWQSSLIHVIEKSAYDQVCKERDDWKKATEIHKELLAAAVKHSMDMQSQLAAKDALLKEAIEVIAYYANHESVIKEAYHSNDEKQITCVHTFINHKAREFLQKIEDGK